MRVRTIGSLYNYVADMNGEHGRPVTLQRVKLSDALKAERNKLFGKKIECKVKVAGRFVSNNKHRTIPIQSAFHDEEKALLLSYGIDFDNGTQKMDKKEFAMKLKRYMEKRCEMSIYEMAVNAYSIEKYYFTASCLIMRYAYDMVPRDTACLFDIKCDIVASAVKKCRDKKFKVGKVLDCMKELYMEMT